jgi:phytoene dehydrogenase-like protein
VEQADVGPAAVGHPTTPVFFQVQLGIDLDLAQYGDEIKRLNFVYPHRDIDKGMANFPLGNVEEAAYYLYVATLHQPEMAPPGMHSIKLECPTRLDSVGIDWDRDKDAIADVFIRRAEALIPDLRRHIVSRRVYTPLDMVRRTANADGAFAGWAFVPELLSRSRPQQRSPLPGLYLAGHWTTPSAGLPWVVLSGYNTAGMVLADGGGHPRWTH